IPAVILGFFHAVPDATEETRELVLALIGLTGIVHGMVIAWRREPDEPLRWYARWPGFLALSFVPAMLLLARYTVLEPYNMSASSMSPTINQGDRILASRRAYDFAAPQRGDLIIFTAMGGVPFIKRVAGLPGDKVQIVDGVLYLNGEPVERVEIEPFPIVHGLPMGSYPQYIETLPGGKSYAVISDSGRSLLESTGVYEVAENCLFVLGDNRPNSNDSRMDLIGCVAEEDVIAKVWLRYWNGRTQTLTIEYLE
ncbi:MAG: signal peptidase I, partial [Alphaproteobacteria bacterium]|nr:signal peptidase I [Alphaproteobacteria bacterium]MDX5415000.1 signal peptidase I [Alphaproteobacteria bacterium]MDX5492185.1 signal peptidase I [Alphaproteobacteria bacterium]